MLQETIRLFQDIDAVAMRPASQERTKLIDLMLRCGLVELVQKMWRQSVKPELLEQTKDLPEHLFTSLTVTTNTFISFVQGQ